MIIVTIRTDKPEAEIGLFENDKQLAYKTWQAHRQLAETIHQKIKAMLALHDKNFSDIEGLVAYAGPGSFTGLRIGLSVVNALADSYGVPAVGATGDDWLAIGCKHIRSAGLHSSVVLPEYGSAVFTTVPRK